MLTANAIAIAAIVAMPPAAQANWQPWTNLGGETLHSGPGAAYVGRVLGLPETSRVFARNVAGMLMMRTLSLTTGEMTWTQLGDRPMVGGPAVVPAQGPIGSPVDAYYRSPDNHVRLANTYLSCHPFVGCGWVTNDADAGGAVTSAPAATYLSSNRVDLFARGTNGQLQHTWRYGTTQDAWAPWEDLGGMTFVESPSAISWWAGNRLDIFVKGADTHLWHRWWTSAQGWTGWENLGGTLTSAPAVVRFDDGRLDVFAKGTSDSLIHMWWTATTGWTGWEDLGGRFQYSPSVSTQAGSNRIDVHVTGSTAQLESTWWG